MSRIFNAALAPFLRSSSVAPPPSASSNQHRTIRQDPRRSSPGNCEFRLPKYKDIGEISYANFLQRVERLNSSDPGEKLSETQVQQALRSTVISVIGTKRYRYMWQTDRPGSQATQDLAEWGRLKAEEAEYWRAEAEKRTITPANGARSTDAGAGTDQGEAGPR